MPKKATPAPKRAAKSSPPAKSAPPAKPVAAPRPVRPVAPPPPPPPRRVFLVRCTFVGELKKVAVEGSFRVILEASDAATVMPKLEKAVRKLRRTTELPSRCAVYVEFVLELAGLDQGVVADFERWEKHPRRFQQGCIAFSDTSIVHQAGAADPAFRFGPTPEPAVVPEATPAAVSPPAVAAPGTPPPPRHAG